jgi:hypothetical protein
VRPSYKYEAALFSCGVTEKGGFVRLSNLVSLPHKYTMMKDRSPSPRAWIPEPVKAKRRFDYLNFIYGVGAAIVLLAAMFKFIGVEYADSIFICGIFMEVLVFLVSAFRWQEREYRWELVFPELLGDLAALNASKQSVRVSISKFLSTVDSLGEISVTSGQLANTLQKINYSIEKLALTQDEVNSSTSEYLDELNKLRVRVKTMNEKADKLSGVTI